MKRKLLNNRRSDQGRTASVLAATLATLLCSSPVWADDTEIFRAPPGGPTPKPNILLIIDTSSSMNTNVASKPLYDYSVSYPGSCNGDQLYWNNFSGAPSCDPSNTKRIDKTAFTCKASTRMLENVGSFTDVLAQHRDDASTTNQSGPGGNQFWQALESGNTTGIVECEKDSGQHGDGRPGVVYAARGSNSDPFTSDATAEIAWGSWPTSQTVTMYDGNYLNYQASSIVEQTKKQDIVIDVVNSVLGAVDDVNVGIMRFNQFDGGPVIAGIQDIASNRQNLQNVVAPLMPGGHTPLAEALFESALYWTGQPARYGVDPNGLASDPSVLDALSVPTYRQPTFEACAKNFNVVLSDGEPRSDKDVLQLNLTSTLPAWEATLGYNSCMDRGNPRLGVRENEGACFRDISAYLSGHDLSSAPGHQSVVTHTIGFDIDLPLLADAAALSGGKYLLADDVESLTGALLDIIHDVERNSVSFASPAVAVNSLNRTQHLSDLYLTTFMPTTDVHWPGNLKKYTLAADGKVLDQAENEAVDASTGLFKPSAASHWSSGTDGNDVLAGGARQHLPAPASRNLFTNNVSNAALTVPANSIDTSNISRFTPSDFGLSGSAAEPTLDELIRWARGEDVQDEDGDPSTLARRSLGDSLHSQPAVVVYDGTGASPDTAVFMATNDGYLHAIDSETGEELWAFIPKELLPNLPKLFVNPGAQFKHYGIDGDLVPISLDKNNNGIIEPNDGDFVYLVFGMRRGGQSYYALDVTDKERPRLLWHTTHPSFGQSWSKPTIAKIAMDYQGLNTHKAVVIVGGGYDTVHDTITHPSSADARGAGIYFLDLVSGEILWRAGADVDAQLRIDDMTRAIPGQVKVIDMSGDGFVDRMYAADMGGQLLRFDIFNGNSPTGRGNDALVTGGVIARLGAEGSSAGIADTRRFYNMPDASLATDLVSNERVVALSIGSGYRAHPLDQRNNDRFYTIWDRQPFARLPQSAYNSYDVATDDDLMEVAGRVAGMSYPTQRGWKYTLPSDQKILASSSTFDGTVYFVAFSPNASSASGCSASGGKNYLYQVGVTNGDPVGDSVSPVPGNDDFGRRSELSNSGIAPTPAFLFPPSPPNCSGEECRPPVVACVGVECFHPGFRNVPVRTAWKDKFGN